MKMTWQTINTVLNRKKNSEKISDNFSHRNSSTTVTDPVNIVNEFNKYFVQTGPQLAKKILNDNSISYRNYLKGIMRKASSLNQLPKTNYLHAEIINLKEKKSAGYDEISAKIIKSIANEIVEPLTYIYNLSFSTGIIPNFLKISLVTPIFKGNETNLFENYRPISVLTNFSKLLEKLMYKRISNYIEKHNILSKHQFGFRKNRSTEDAILELTDKISKALDERKYTLGIFLDLCKHIEP